MVRYNSPFFAKAEHTNFLSLVRVSEITTPEEEAEEEDDAEEEAEKEEE